MYIKIKYQLGRVYISVIPCCFARPSRYSLYVNDGEEQVLYGQESMCVCAIL